MYFLPINSMLFIWTNSFCFVLKPQVFGSTSLVQLSIASQTKKKYISCLHPTPPGLFQHAYSISQILRYQIQIQAIIHPFITLDQRLTRVQSSNTFSRLFCHRLQFISRYIDQAHASHMLHLLKLTRISIRIIKHVHQYS